MGISSPDDFEGESWKCLSKADHRNGGPLDRRRIARISAGVPFNGRQGVAISVAGIVMAIVVAVATARPAPSPHCPVPP